MSNDNGHVHHAIDYIELTVADMAAARSFYGAAFGWTFNEYGPEYSGIVAMDGSGREAGGLCVGPAVGDRGAGGALVVLYSADLEGTVAAVLEAGGEIVKEIPASWYR